MSDDGCMLIVLEIVVQSRNQNQACGYKESGRSADKSADLHKCAHLKLNWESTQIFMSNRTPSIVKCKELF